MKGTATFLSKVVVLIEPLVSRDSRAGLFTTGNVLEPYALECLAASIEERGYEAIVLQEDLASGSDLENRVLKTNPVCVGLSVLTHTFDRCKQFAMRLKALDPCLPIVIGGQHPSLVPDCVGQSCFDFAVIGEGEVTFCELLDHLAKHNQDSPTDIAGLAIRERNGAVVRTAARERLGNLDVLPSAKRIPKYLERSRSYNLTYPSALCQVAVAQVGYSRGCRYNCTFCVSPSVWSKAHSAAEERTVTYRSASSVAEEISQLRDQYGVNFVYFTDLTFNDDPRRLQELCEAFIDRGLHEGNELDQTHVLRSVHWFALLKVGLDEKTANLMARAGCSKIGMGIESFDTDLVHAYRKPYTGLEAVTHSLLATDAVGIINRCLLVLGAPGENPESISNTIECLKRLPVDQLRLAFLTPYPNTPIARDLHVEPDGGYCRDLSRYDEESPVIHCRHFSWDALRFQRARIAREVYMSLEYRRRFEHKVRRFPWLNESYAYFFRELYSSNPATDLRSLVESENR